jgi:GPH family glycoside/pentoside/hexuronide:cation symporter
MPGSEAIVSPTLETPAAPPDDKVPLPAKAAYAFGGVNDIYGHWWYANISNQVFNMHLHLSTSLIGAVLMITRIFDAFTDTFFGWVSDNTRTRWGRRRPFILFGSIAAGVALPCLFLASTKWDASLPWMHNRVFWFMMITSLLYAPIISLYAMPYSSLGSELTPNYHERTIVMGWKAIVQKISGVYMMSAWWIAQSFRIDPATGKPDVLSGIQFASAIAGGVMILAGFANFFCVKERYYAKAHAQPRTHFWTSCGQTFSSRPFLVLLGILAVYAVPTSMVSSLGSYAGTYYVFRGDQELMGKFQSYSSVGYFIFGAGGVFLTSWISKTYGKRKALVFTLATGILTFGSSWWMYQPGNGWMIVLNTAFTGFSATGFWVVLPSMCVDVVDHDESRTHLRREGAFTSLFSWTAKMGMALAMGVTGFLLDATGFKAELEGNQTAGAIWWIRFLFAAIPVIAMFIALALIAFYPLSQERMRAIRDELEARRGTV